MSKLKKIAKWLLIGLSFSIFLLVGFGWWFMNLLSPTDPSKENQKHTLTSSLPYLSNTPELKRGKILAVVTSTAFFENTDKRTGYELTELAQAYSVFVANGFEVDIASPKGGEPPMILDEEDMGVYDYAFLNDSLVQAKIKSTIPMDSVRIEDYEAIYFVGGKGAMFDFPNNKSIQHAIRTLYEVGKVIGAVCHGPSAFVNVTLTDGTPFLKGRKVSAFTNQEELFLIENAREIFPFLLQDQLIKKGALFSEGAMYLENVIVDEKIVTGQNPWSTWTVAESMVKQLGYKPKNRRKSDSENAVMVLKSYEENGSETAKHLIFEMREGGNLIGRDLIAMHALVAVMQWKIIKGIEIVGLLVMMRQIVRQ